MPPVSGWPSEESSIESIVLEREKELSIVDIVAVHGNILWEQASEVKLMEATWSLVEDGEE